MGTISIHACRAGDAYMVAAGHDEDEDKARKGSPVERVIAMARAMVDAVQNLTAPNGEKLQIRIVSQRTYGCECRLSRVRLACSGLKLPWFRCLPVSLGHPLWPCIRWSHWCQVSSLLLPGGHSEHRIQVRYFAQDH